MRPGAEKERDYSFGILNSLLKNPCRALGDFQTTIFITKLLLSRGDQRLQQAQPHAISKNATRNKSAPVGKIAAIRMPHPRATARMPKRPQPGSPLRNIRRTSLLFFNILLLDCPVCEKNDPKRFFRFGSWVIFFRAPANPEWVSVPHTAAGSSRAAFSGSSRLSKPPGPRSPFPWCGCTPQSGIHPDKGQIR